MSSRALRKAQKERERQEQEDRLADADSVSDEEPVFSAKQSAFSILGNADNGVEEKGEEEEEPSEEQAKSGASLHGEASDEYGEVFSQDARLYHY